MDKILSATLFALCASLATVSHAALIKVSFTATLAYKFTTQLGSDSLPDRIVDFDNYLGISFNGSLSFDSQAQSTTVYSVPNGSEAEFSFGDITFSLSPEIESELALYSNVGFSQSYFVSNRAIWEKSYTTFGSGRTTNYVKLNSSELGVTYRDNGFIESFIHEFSIDLPSFLTFFETPEEAITPPETSDFISYFNQRISAGQRTIFTGQAPFTFGSHYYNCDYGDLVPDIFPFPSPQIATTCTVAEGVAYLGSLVMTDVSIVPIPAGAWLFGSAIAGLFGLRIKTK